MSSRHLVECNGKAVVAMIRNADAICKRDGLLIYPEEEPRWEEPAVVEERFRSPSFLVEGRRNITRRDALV
jgi:hypothetical protein